MNLLRKTVTTLLAGSALAVVSSQASAVGITAQLTFDRSAPATFSGNSPVKNWADMAIDLGWMHTTKWVTLHVANGGHAQITLADTSAAATTTTSSANATTGNTTATTNTSNGISSNPAFSLWSFGGTPAANVGSQMTSAGNLTLATSPLASHYNGTGTQTNSTMGYNQVTAPADGNNSAFLAYGGVNGFVGYVNAGDTFVNGNGDAVGHGSTGSSYGTDANGHKYATLDIANLAAGDYLLAVGFSCVNLTNCGNEVTSKRVVVTNTATGALISDTTTLNPANTWGLANYNLSVTAVPVPAAVWLFGSALAGMGIIGRRKEKASA